MIVRLPRNFLFPLTTLAFVAIPVSYVNFVFTTSTRWFFLAVLLLYIVVKRWFLFGFQSAFGVALLSYCTWGLLTASWSLVPELSFEKAAAFTLVAATLISAGQEWTFSRGGLKALTCLFPVAGVALFAATGHGDVVYKAKVDELAVGLTSNPNMLGSLISMALPILLWSAYQYRANSRLRWLFVLLLTFSVVMLVRTYSRSAILSTGMLGLGFCLSIRMARSTFVLALIALSLLMAAAVGTAFVHTTYDDYVLKGGSEAEGIFFSRDLVWRQSYANAEVGGWFGVGYGASVGDTVFNGGLTAFGYGREKGNTQLAIIEETGLIGIGLYAVLLLCLFTRLAGAYQRERNSDTKVVLGIIIGELAGLTLMSVFEAWWVAPGSAESAYFWSVAGVGLGIAQKSLYASKWPNARTARESAFNTGGLVVQRSARS